VHPSDNNTGSAPPSGYYQTYVGLFMGAERIKVVAGPSDGENRARLGGLAVR
jgi:hypothetical protein